MTEPLSNLPEHLRDKMRAAVDHYWEGSSFESHRDALEAINLVYPLMAEHFAVGQQPLLDEAKAAREWASVVIPDFEPPLSEEEAFKERWEYDKELNLWVHAKGTCRGKYCCIHNPSDHPLKDARRKWRGDRNLMERVCSHGVGHPDPDDIAYHRLLEADPDNDDPDPSGRGIHGCCMERCCSIKV